MPAFGCQKSRSVNIETMGVMCQDEAHDTVGFYSVPYVWVPPLAACRPLGSMVERFSIWSAV